MSDERTKEQLREALERERSKREKLEQAFAELQEYVPQVNTKTTRRSVLGSIVGGVGLYLALGTASAQTTGSGQIASSANPALRVYVNRVHFVERTSDPSSPADGTMWYNSSA